MTTYTADYDTRMEVAFLERWARENGCRFEPEGECGFGRECVGITTGSEYPSYEAYETLEERPWVRETHSCPEAAPPPEVRNAYHKHPCLAVLGRGPAAIHELYVWVSALAERGIVVEQRPRRGRAIDILINGATEALLVRSGHVD